MAYRDSTSAVGDTATPAVAVPAGVAANDIIILVATIDSGSPFAPGVFPSGFTEIAEANVTADGHTSAVGWKRTTGADSGSYTFSALPSAANWVCQAFAFSGRHTTNPPVVSTPNIQNTPQSSPITVSANGVTAVLGDDLIWISAPDVTSVNAGNGHTAPASYTEREDAENGWSNLSGATRDNVAAGATGTVSGTFALSQDTAGWAAYLVRIPVAGGTTFNSTPGGSSTPTGAVSKQVSKSLSGASTPVGTISKLVSKIFGGASTPVGTLSILRAIFQSFSGSSTPVGTLTRQVDKSFSGSSTPIGTLAKLIGKFFSGLSTPIGTLITQLTQGSQQEIYVTVSVRLVTNVNINVAPATGVYLYVELG